MNYSEMCRILVEIDKNFSTILPVDGVTWSMSTLSDELDEGITKNLIMYHKQFLNRRNLEKKDEDLYNHTVSFIIHSIFLMLRWAV